MYIFICGKEIIKTNEICHLPKSTYNSAIFITTYFSLNDRNIFKIVFRMALFFILNKNARYH